MEEIRSEEKQTNFYTELYKAIGVFGNTVLKNGEDMPVVLTEEVQSMLKIIKNVSWN